MLGGERRHQELVYSLLFSLPGTPILRYGEEIGMGDDLSLPGRMSVRTPMQWSSEPNGGFSAASAEHLVRPVVSGGKYGYERINVDAQRSDPASLLNFVLRLVRTRKECPELGEGDPTVIETGDSRVFAHLCEWRGGLVLAIHNLSGEACEVSLDLPAESIGRLVDLLGDRVYEPVRGTPLRLRLDGYGYRWLRAHPPRSGPPA